MTLAATISPTDLLSPGLRQLLKNKPEGRRWPRVSIDEINAMADDDLALHPALQEDNRGKLTKFFDFIDIPRNLIGNVIGSLAGVEKEGMERGAFGLQRIFMSDVLIRLGVQDRAARAIAGFAGDVAIDPLTYLGGASTMKIGAVAMKKAAKKEIATAARMAADGIAPRGSLAKFFSESHLKRLAQIGDKKAAQSSAAKHIRKIVTKELTSPDWKGQAAREFAEQYGVKGKALFHLPFTAKEKVLLPIGTGVKLQSALKVARESGDFEPLLQWAQRAELGPELLGKRIAPYLKRVFGEVPGQQLADAMSSAHRGVRQAIGTAQKSGMEQRQDIRTVAMRQAETEALPTFEATRRLGLPVEAKEHIGFADPLAAREPLVADMAEELVAQGMDESLAYRTSMDNALANLEAHNLPNYQPLERVKRHMKATRNWTDDEFIEAVEAGGANYDSIANMSQKQQMDWVNARFPPDKVGDIRLPGTELVDVDGVWKVAPEDSDLLAILGDDTYRAAFATPDTPASKRMFSYRNQLREIADREEAVGLLPLRIEDGYAPHILSAKAWEQVQRVGNWKGSAFERILRGPAQSTHSKHRTAFHITDYSSGQPKRIYNPTDAEIADIRAIPGNENSDIIPSTVFDLNKAAKRGEFDEWMGPDWEKLGEDAFLVSPTEQLARRQLTSQKNIAMRNYQQYVTGTFGKSFLRAQYEWADKSKLVEQGHHVTYPDAPTRLGLVQSIDEDGFARVAHEMPDGSIQQFEIPRNDLTFVHNVGVRNWDDFVPPPEMLDDYRRIPELDTLSDFEGGQIVAFPNEVADDVQDLHNMWFNPENGQLEGALGIANRLNSVLKRFLLWSPPYVPVNATGNVFNGRTFGFGSRGSDLVDFVHSSRAVYYSRRFANKLDDMPPLVTDLGEIHSEKKLLQEATSRKVLRTTTLEDLDSGLHDAAKFALLRNLPLPDQASYTKAMGKVTGGIKSFMDWTIFKPNAYMEEVFKYGAFKSMVRRGDSYEEAARKVTEVFFDYSRATPLERTYAVPMFGFWRWVRNNSALQMRLLATQPRYAALVPKINRAIGVDHPMTEELMSEFVEELQGTQIMGGLGGGPTFTTLSALPQHELKWLTNPFEEFTESLGPLLSIPISLGTGREVFTQRRITGPGERIQETTQGEYLLNQLRFLRDFKRLGRQEGPAGVAAAAVWGGRIQQQTAERGLARKAKETTDALRILRSRVKNPRLSDEERAETANQILEVYTERARWQLPIPVAAATALAGRGVTSPATPEGYEIPQ